MPPRNGKARIEDILDAIAKTQRYAHGMSFDSFQADEKTVDSVLYNFAIIGEAARLVPPEVQSRHPTIPWSSIRGMRNVVIHEYAGVSLRIVWETIANDLTPLISPLRDILVREP